MTVPYDVRSNFCSDVIVIVFRIRIRHCADAHRQAGQWSVFTGCGGREKNKNGKVIMQRGPGGKMIRKVVSTYVPSLFLC